MPLRTNMVRGPFVAVWEYIQERKADCAAYIVVMAYILLARIVMASVVMSRVVVA